MLNLKKDQKDINLFCCYSRYGDQLVDVEIVKKWASRIAWAYSVISVVIVIITFFSYNVFGPYELINEVVALYWFLIIIAVIYPVAYLFYMITKQLNLNKKVMEVLKSHSRITAYQASKLLEEPLWLVKQAFKKSKMGVVANISGDMVHFREKPIISTIKALYKENKDLGIVSTELNKKKIVLTKKNIRIILDELLDREDPDIIEIEDKRYKTEEKEDI